MVSFDFDNHVQSILNQKCSNIPKIEWRKWLEVNSKEEYLNLVLKQSGLHQINNILTRIHQEKTNSRSFSVEIEKVLDKQKEKEISIFTHTSGTTNSNLSALKWFHITEYLLKRLWAPGMQAIFESSGLNTKSSAVIFVPSRLNLDGIQKKNDKDYISLYSSEFSQRVMLGLIQPKSYLFYPYKEALNLEIIAKILLLDDISVISAPAATVLKWANLSKLRLGLQKSYSVMKTDQDNRSDELYKLIDLKGIERAAKEIQQLLSNKLLKATLIFSISSLNQKQWELIRDFMRWKKGEEKFTNLYVGSEIGPFAASISYKQIKVSDKENMFIFPLTLPVIEYKGFKELIHESKKKRGNLLVSRRNGEQELINIDTGDFIQVKNQAGLPQIGGKILRDNFQLKYKVHISEQVKIPKNSILYAGDYFNFGSLEIIEPRNLLFCLNSTCGYNFDALLLMSENEGASWTLYLKSGEDGHCKSSENIREAIFNCPHESTIPKAIEQNKIKIELINDYPVDFLKEREEILEKVRTGKSPKGILKKWPLYVVIMHNLTKN